MLTEKAVRLSNPPFEFHTKTVSKKVSKEKRAADYKYLKLD